MTPQETTTDAGAARVGGQESPEEPDDAPETPVSGWIHLHEDEDDLRRVPKVLEALLDEHSPGTLFWVPASEWHCVVHGPADPDPEWLFRAGNPLFADDVWNYDEGGFGRLLYVEPTGRSKPIEEVDELQWELIFDWEENYESGRLGRFVLRRAEDLYEDDELAVEYQVTAVHSPRDVHGPKGTPMRDLHEALTGNNILAENVQMPDITTYEELHKIRDLEQAAVDALRASGEAPYAEWSRNHFPGCDVYGAEFPALAARHLIGTTPEWTREAYDYLASRYVAATGHGLHPDDDITAPARAEEPRETPKARSDR